MIILLESSLKSFFSLYFKSRTTRILLLQVRRVYAFWKVCKRTVSFKWEPFKHLSMGNISLSLFESKNSKLFDLLICHGLSSGLFLSGYWAYVSVSGEIQCNIPSGLDRSQAEYHHPFPVSSASVADGAVAYDGSYTFHFEHVKFSCYVEAVTHDISSSITETKFVVNSKSEKIFILCPYDWMPLPCFLHHAYLS